MWLLRFTYISVCETSTHRHWPFFDARNTPHAFSHFTFEASGAEQIVVDIQGLIGWSDTVVIENTHKSWANLRLLLCVHEHEHV